ncbi:MAG: phosphatidylinositol dimannoside acyltransferase [Actinomycetota bacterium]
MGIRQRAPYLAYRAAAEVANALPRPLAAATADGLGLVLSRTMQGRRRMLERHLRRAYGEGLSDAALEREVRRTFRSYARYWMESFRLANTPRSALDDGMTWEGVGHLEDALALGKGAISVMPHLGGWDFGAAWFCALGYPVTVVAERIDPPELFDWFVSLRSEMGMKVVPLGPEAGTAVLRALKHNELVGLICDRDIGGTGVEVEFFGERTTLPSGPATLALRTGAPVIPTAVYFRGRNSHHGVMRPPIVAERQGRMRDDVVRVTQAVADELEALIRVAPDQWHLLQPNWPSDREAIPKD